MPSTAEANCSDPEFTFVTVTSLCFAVTTIIFVCFLSFKFSSKFRNDSKMSGRRDLCFVSHLIIIVTILLGFAIICQLFVCFFDLKAIILKVTTVQSMLWAYDCTFILFIFLIRLHDVFQGTIYAYSDRQWLILKSISLIIGIVGTVGCLSFLYYVDMAYILSCIGLISYILFAFVILFLFINGLFKVQANTRSRQSVLSIQHTITKESITDVQLILIKTMSKYVVLVSISLLTTAISLIFVCLQFIFFTQTEERKNGIVVVYIGWNWLLIDMTVNLLSFMTQFQFFANDHYYKYCIKCDNLCQDIVKYQAVKDLKRKKQQSHEEIEPQSPQSLSVNVT